MNSLFLILFLLSGVLLIVGLLKPDAVIRWGDPEKRGRKQVLITYVSIAVVTFIAFGVTIDKTKTATNKDQPNTQQAVQTAPAPTPSLTIEQQIEKAAKNVTGSSFRKITITPTTDDKNLIDIHITGNENLTTSMTRKGLYMDGANLFEKLYATGLPIKEVREFIYLPLIDKYGNKADEIVVKMSLKAETAAKINWGNVSKSEFDKVADQSKTHSALLQD